MLVRLTYIFETAGGFRYEREEPCEILKIARDNYRELKKLATEAGDYADWYIDTADPLMPHGIITSCIKGVSKSYTLWTEMTPVNENES